MSQSWDGRVFHTLLGLPHHLQAQLALRQPGGSDSKESACNAEDLGSIPGLGSSPGEGNSYPLQYSGLENSMEEPGRLQSMGLQRVRHDWAAFTSHFPGKQVSASCSWYSTRIMFGQGSDITACNHCLLILRVTGAWDVCPERTLLSFRTGYVKGLFSRTWGGKGPLSSQDPGPLCWVLSSVSLRSCQRPRYQLCPPHCVTLSFGLLDIPTQLLERASQAVWVKCLDRARQCRHWFCCSLVILAWSECSHSHTVILACSSLWLVVLVWGKCLHSYTVTAVLHVILVQWLSHIWLCDPMDCWMPGSSILQYLLEFAQIHVHWVGNAIQPSHPLQPPFPGLRVKLLPGLLVTA